MRRRPPGRRSRAEDNEFAQEIAAAAGPVLAPLGLRQKGRLPLWIGDQHYWVILVDFQPGVLTVGASFLWWTQSRWSFDDGQRFADPGDASHMARRAGEEVAALRARFPSVAAIATLLVARAGHGPWPVYHAAVAAGLAGHRDAARPLFQRLVELPATRDWEGALADQARAFVDVLDDATAFRGAVADLVNRMRALQGLPRDDQCLDGTP